MTQDIGRIGIWSMEMRFGDHGQAAEAIAELDELGYGALWMPGGIGGDLTGDFDRLLGASSRITIASGILNIWKHTPADVATWFKGLSADRQQRVLLGLGVSHSHIVGDAYAAVKPLAAMRDYLDQLAAQGVPGDSLCLAALGPKMLELAGKRTAGVHPYLVTPEHTALARSALGPDRLVAPEQGVVLESDPAKARDLARKALSQYQAYPNYRNNWLRLGFSEAEIDSGSDALVDALFVWGSVEKIAERVDAHFAAGANHVCLQVITGAGLDIGAARPAWRELASALL
ncbi:TIGR03620 family F420-dependent LLM class oxidoreductase [Sphingobium sufflavum]|uniref:TIGR03620 family F420-dependent LLM class oxidoreductase n=1 Tax=Sphingobium sufflavum TaxID=1129547 RepID=UPI001F1B9104|nr:TIGR03620 family F420-dependent LLM class oxidoreductase [Sphingobium sufflavum]MCE7795073.1 TIGR03620 family F420-dependent LLM class oxidoreductase [Sphingobium sufflavum]